eukprot:gene21549-biopygen13203
MQRATVQVTATGNGTVQRQRYTEATATVLATVAPVALAARGSHKCHHKDPCGDICDSHVPQGPQEPRGPKALIH